MSDGLIPKSRLDSGEVRAYLHSHIGAAVGIISIAAVFVGLVLYIGSKAPSKDVHDLKEVMRKYTSASVSRAITAHEAKNAHHGVAGMIVRYAPSRVDFVHLKARVEQIERRNAEWRRDIKDALKEIKITLRDMSSRLPRRRRRRKP